MRLIKTAADDEQIKIKTTPEEAAPIIRKIVINHACKFVPGVKLSRLLSPRISAC